MKDRFRPFLLRNSDAPNEVVVPFEAADLRRAEAYAGPAELRECPQQRGVINTPAGYLLYR